MIQSPEGMDRGLFLYQKFPKAVKNYVKDRKDTYFDSKPAKALKSRVKLIDDIIDMKFPQSESAIAEVAMPVVRKRWRELNAFIRKYFENDPMITFTQIGNTPEENARLRTQLVNRNFASTEFRRDCFRWIIDSAARYGSYVTFTQYAEKSGRSAGLKTQYNPDAPNPYARAYQQERRQNAITYPVHILNYFCDIDKNCFSKGTYEGINDNWRISTLYLLLNDENYIRENVEKIIEQCKKGHVDEHWHGNESEIADYSRETVTVSRVFTNLNFAGNEDDPGEYYVEFIDGEIIRINESGLDDNERPISTGTLINRTNTWWGNTDLEDVIPQQNVKNWLMQTEIESVAKQLDSFILARRGSIDASDWNARHQLGGLVYTDNDTTPLDSLMYQFQRRDFSLNNLDWVNREINQSVQESSPIVNLQNKYNQGGLNNSTLGAAQMVASIGEILQYDMMNNFSYGLLHIGKICANILEIMLDDTFKMPIKNQTVILQKHQIMGDFGMLHESTLKINDVTEFTKKVNQLTQFLNWRGTGDPAFQGINVPKMVRDVIKAGNGWYSDVDDYYTEQPMQQQPIGPTGQPQQAMLAPQQPQPQLTGVNG